MRHNKLLYSNILASTWPSGQVNMVVWVGRRSMVWTRLWLQRPSRLLADCYMAVRNLAIATTESNILSWLMIRDPL